MYNNKVNSADKAPVVKGMLIKYNRQLSADEKRQIVNELYPQYNMLAFKRKEILTLFGDLTPLSESEKKFVIRHYNNYTAREIAMMLNKQVSQVHSIISARGLTKGASVIEVKEVGHE